MKGVVWEAPYRVRVADGLLLPRVLGPRDAVIRVTRSAICGTDLHAYRGDITGFPSGTIMGHEFTGIIEELGTAVRNFQVGDRVLASDIIACGECWFCQRGWHYQCEQVSLFGYGTVVGPYVPGGQAELVRVPFADVVLSSVPEELTDEQVLFVGDILSTGYICAREAGISLGDYVAVVGCGPVGLCALMVAGLMSAISVLAIDTDARRRAVAAELGGHPIDPAAGVETMIKDLTGGRGADVVLEAVGSDDALLTALSIVRPRGTVSAVGAHHSSAMPFPSGLAFNHELAFRFSVGDPISARSTLLPLISTGRLNPSRIISHRLPLDAAAEGYTLFDQHQATKVVLIPGDY